MVWSWWWCAAFVVATFFFYTISWGSAGVTLRVHYMAIHEFPSGTGEFLKETLALNFQSSLMNQWKENKANSER